MAKIFFSFFILIATATKAATIDGTVVNGTFDKSAVAGANVVLQRLAANSKMPTKLLETTASNDGRFSFQLDRPDPASIYYVSANYQGVSYFGDAITLEADSHVNATLVVYDSTHSAEHVDVFMHHLFITPAAQGISVREVHVLNNADVRTITHALVDEQAGAATFKFPLPAGATNFRSLSAHAADEMVRMGDFVYDRSLFLPGKKTVTFAYDLPLRGREKAVTFRVPHLARTFDIFTDKIIALKSDKLTDYGSAVIEGMTYNRYGMANVPAGSTVRATIVRKKSALPSQSPTLVLLSTGLLLIAGLLLSRAKSKADGSPSKATMKDIRARRAELIEHIAQIDAGEMDADAEERQRLFNQLLLIEQQQKAAKKSRRKNDQS